MYKFAKLAALTAFTLSVPSSIFAEEKEIRPTKSSNIFNSLLVSSANEREPETGPPSCPNYPYCDFSEKYNMSSYVYESNSIPTPLKSNKRKSE